MAFLKQISRLGVIIEYSNLKLPIGFVGIDFV